MTELERLWYDTLQDIGNLSAHEIKDVLNGVALNVEVLRSRSEKGTSESRALYQFAAAASDQTEKLVARVEALLDLMRPASRYSAPVEIGVILRSLVALLAPAARARGGALELVGLDRAATTTAAPDAVRLALASGLLASTRDGQKATCVLASGDSARVEMTRGMKEPPALRGEVADELARQQIRIDRPDSRLVMIFP